MLFLRFPSRTQGFRLGRLQVPRDGTVTRSAELWKPPGRGATSTGHPACYGTAEAIGRPRGSAQMMRRAWLSSAAVIGFTLISVACGSNPRPQTPQPAASKPASIPPVQAATQPPPDPIATLLKTSREHFDAGERELKMGHLERARSEFDQALDVLLQSPYGARSDARLRVEFDRMADQINAYEMTSIDQGDGFAETKCQPAPPDELLKIATFPKPDADVATTAAVKADLEATEHDIPIPQNSRILSYVELFQGRLHDYIDESLRRGAKYLPMIQTVFRAEGLPLDLA